MIIGTLDTPYFSSTLAAVLVPAFPVVLASASPRRRELLKKLLAEFNLANPNIDENSNVLPLEERARLLALEKARRCRRAGSLVIGSDTIVGLGDESLGKPNDATEARDMLERLSGRTHRVITGVGLVWDTGEDSFVEVAKVTFRKLNKTEIDDYVAGGEPMDKAGAYAIQGGAAEFAESIGGDIHTVVGLPVARLADSLVGLGLAEQMV